MLKIGVLGAGHLGKIHLKLLQQSDKYELIGFFDPNTENAQKVVVEFGYHLFDSVSSLIDAVDVVDIVTPTLSHFDCAKEAISKGKHIFIEKPITNTVAEAEAIRTMVSQAHVKGQVVMLSVLIRHLLRLRILFQTRCLLKLTDWLNLIQGVQMFLLS